LLAGCIQPVETEPTPGPNDVPVQPPGADAAVPAAPAGDSASLIPVIEQFIRDRGEAPGNLLELVHRYFGLPPEEWGRDLIRGHYGWRNGTPTPDRKP